MSVPNDKKVEIAGLKKFLLGYTKKQDKESKEPFDVDRSKITKDHVS
jgi:hypothetical protein